MRYNLWLFHWLPHKPVHTLEPRRFLLDPRYFSLSHETSSGGDMQPFREIVGGRFRRSCVDRRPYTVHLTCLLDCLSVAGAVKGVAARLRPRWHPRLSWTCRGACSGGGGGGGGGGGAAAAAVA